MSWIDTYTGQRFTYFSEDTDSIVIEDIAHGLANICRFTGQCRYFYSVAQHCVMATHLVPANLKLQAILHDSAETYISDLPRPLKQLFPEIKALEKNILKRIFIKFNVPFPEDPLVKIADEQLLFAEAEKLFTKGTSEWECNIKHKLKSNPFEFVGFWEPKLAEMRFLETFYHLYKG